MRSNCFLKHCPYSDIWPSWVQRSLFWLEPNEKRKKILSIVGIFGIGFSMLAIYVLLRSEVKALVSGHSLAYQFVNLKKTWPASVALPFYLVATLIPFFISSLQIVKVAGYLVFFSLLASQLINQETTTSVWCFFIAGYILWMLGAKDLAIASLRENVFRKNGVFRGARRIPPPRSFTQLI